MTKDNPYRGDIEEMTKDNPYRVVLMRVSCIGCMACTKLAPKVFEPDNKTGLARIRDGKEIYRGVEYITVGGEDIDSVLRSTEICPTDTILVWDHEGNLVNRKQLASYVAPLRPYV